MANSVVHFSVYADDPDRAMRFYTRVFDWQFEPWGPPGYWKIQTGKGPGTTLGALSQRLSPRGEGTPNAFRCTVSVVDLDASIAAITSTGGSIHSTVAEIPTVGRVVEFVDSEGNLACIMQHEKGHPMAAPELG